MVKVWLCCCGCFDDDILDLVEKLLTVSAAVLKDFKDRFQASFMAGLLIITRFFCLLVGGAVLIDCIVSQVHVQVVHIACIRALIWLCAESC